MANKAIQSLKWDQVNAWRLAQHYLSSRLQRPNFVKAVMATGGIQAQLMSAAELALQEGETVSAIVKATSVHLAAHSSLQ